MAKSVRKKQRRDGRSSDSLFDDRATPKPPDFDSLLRKPHVKLPLPPDFDVSVEATHLRELWETTTRLHRFDFRTFIHAGGSGLVFEVYDSGDETSTSYAMKIVRHRLYESQGLHNDAARNLSPVSDVELKALRILKHPNLVLLNDAISNDRGVVAICTSFVPDPKPIDLYLHDVLQSDPSAHGLHAFSPERLDRACAFLAQKAREIASTIRYMHDQQVFHFHIKPANVLISSQRHVVLTDMGACVHASDIPVATPLRVHFTWTYAHPDLTNLIRDQKGISGGGVRVSAQLPSHDRLARFDLFAFGRTLQETLAILEIEFRERAHACYGFRFLHMIACLLLDGENAPGTSDGGGGASVLRDNHPFVQDVALNYPPELFAAHKITNATQLCEKLARFSRDFSWNASIPELDTWQPGQINIVVHSPAPFSERIASLFNHPAVRRLKLQPQLGWIREVFPGATHDRWSHSVGVFSALTAVYNALLADPEIPTFRILIERDDVLTAFVAAIIHDIGQTTFGHDFEEACEPSFRHEGITARLLDETKWGKETLRKAIGTAFRGVDIDRVLAILKSPREGQAGDGTDDSAAKSPPVDGIAQDEVNGPIDADKLDYLMRDAVNCGVPYGLAIDARRFAQALTVAIRQDPLGRPRLELAYRAKGRAAVESLLLARYQMYNAVYWHHTFRCVQSMFVHCAAATFGGIADGPQTLRGVKLDIKLLDDLFYLRVVLGNTWPECARATRRKNLSEFDVAPAQVGAEPALEFVWQFAELGERDLLERLGKRNLYKRIYEVRLGELGGRVSYEQLRQHLLPRDRIKKAVLLRTDLEKQIYVVMQKRGPGETRTESAARRRLKELRALVSPLIVLDFPVRGIPHLDQIPKELGDPIRKYFTLPRRRVSEADNVFLTVKRLQEQVTTVRVFAAPELHELIIRYLSPNEIQACIEHVIPLLRQQV